MRYAHLALELLATLACGAASATTFTYDFSGALRADSPTFVAPQPTTPPTAWSDPESVAYAAFAFSVSVAGDYSFISTADRYDNVTLLYGGSFDPASPLAHGLTGNDDLPDHLHSGFTYRLETGSNYVFVNTSLYSHAYGNFTASITGPGQVLPLASAVPEPGSLALMLAGMGMVTATVARRRGRRAQGPGRPAARPPVVRG